MRTVFGLEKHFFKNNKSDLLILNAKKNGKISLDGAVSS